MKAVRFHEYGDPDVLREEDDDGIRGGYLQGPFPVTLPHTPGIDVKFDPVPKARGSR